MIDKSILDEPRGRDVILFVADEGEIAQEKVPFPVVYTGMGKMRMFSALVKWYEARTGKGKPVILNVGTNATLECWKKGERDPRWVLPVDIDTLRIVK